MPLSALARRTRGAAFLLCAVSAIACSDDDPTGPVGGDEIRTLTVDASAGWAFVDLENNAVVSVDEPTSSDAWDIAFNATSVMLNGGAAGPGNVSAACDCGSFTLEDVEELTPESELPRFEAATATTIPAASEFVMDELQPAIAEWYSGAPGAAATANTARTFILRRSEPTQYAKVRVTGITGATADSPGEVMLDYAVQPAAGGEFGSAQTRTVTVGAATEYVDIFGGGGGDAASWDLSFDGWTVRVNGGVSGSGVAAVALDEPFADVNTTTAATIPAGIYAGDQYAGIFAEHPWHVYSGPPLHQVYPTFDVYYVKRDDVVYKLQVTSYYGAAGQARHITFRSARL